jgi:hypothetical protein
MSQATFHGVEQLEFHAFLTVRTSVDARTFGRSTLLM